MSALCGIMIDAPKVEINEHLQKMNNVMAFRGGERSITYCTHGFGIGMISDFTEVAHNENQTILAVMDGEIYNSDDIAWQLESKGHILSEKSPISILPHLYEEYGHDFPAPLNGSFVIGIYDFSCGRFLLARDHMGSRTAFYFVKNGMFSFASTVKALLALKLFSPTLSLKAINLYFAGTCVPHPYTMFEEIRNLRPAHVVEYSDDHLYEYEYWNLGNLEEDYKTTEKDFAAQIRSLCLDAIKIRTKGTNKLGAVLSGGVDSSLIAAVVSIEKSPDKLPTFSIGFEESGFDDSPLQNVMLGKFNLEGHRVVFKSKDAISALLSVIANVDYPLNNASAMGTYLCMREAASCGITHILDGEAADELFCGGGGVVGEHLVEFFEKLPLWFRKLIFGRIGKSLYAGEKNKIYSVKRFFYRTVMDPIDRMLTWLPSFDRDIRKKLFVGDLREYVDMVDELETGRLYLARAKFKDGLNIYQYGACRTYLCDDLLFKNERMASAHGLMNRTPFVDPRLVELAFRIPARFKLKGFTTKTAEKKVIYRKAIRELIPDEILWRKKTRGFSQPVNLWMRNELRKFLEEIILEGKFICKGLCSRSVVRRLVREHVEGLADHDRLLWALLVLELWLRKFVDRQG